MRKALTIISVLALVLVGFMAMANPVAACDGDPPITKESAPYCHWGTNDAVPLGMDVAWMIWINVTNSGPNKWTDVVVKDRLGGELEFHYVCYITLGSLTYETKGATEKVFLTWTIGELPAGGVASVCFMISTDVNPGGQQEYTSPGDYELNSGATLKYKMCGTQYSYSTEPIPITVVGEEED